jgi:hypothetical protein
MLVRRKWTDEWSCPVNCDCAVGDYSLRGAGLVCSAELGAEFRLLWEDVTADLHGFEFPVFDLRTGRGLGVRLAIRGLSDGAALLHIDCHRDSPPFGA